MGPKGKKVRQKLKPRGGKEYDGLFVYQPSVPIDFDQEVPSMAEQHKRSMDAYLLHAREYAGAVLRKAGLPDTLRWVQRLDKKRPDGWSDWAELPDEFRKDFWKAVENLPDGESIETATVVDLAYSKEPVTPLPDGHENWTDEEFETYFESLPPRPVKAPAAGEEHVLTPEWFACRVLECADILEADIARGDGMAIGVSTAQLSRALNALTMTDRYQPATVIGLKQLSNGASGKRGGRPGTPDSVIADLERQADEIWGRNPKQSVHAIAVAIQKKNPAGPCVRTIERRLKDLFGTPKERRQKRL